MPQQALCFKKLYGILNKGPSKKTHSVNSELYDKEYYEAADGAEYFAENKTASKLVYAIKTSRISKGDKALGIGCGRGDLMIALAQTGAIVSGIDYSKDALEIGQKTIISQPP